MLIQVCRTHDDHLLPATTIIIPCPVSYHHNFTQSHATLTYIILESCYD